jgi:hypothetical protein
MGKGKALLSRRGRQRKFLLGMEERGRSTEVEDDWDCSPVLKRQLYAFAVDNVAYLFQQGRHWYINSCGSAKLWQ